MSIRVWVIAPEISWVNNTDSSGDIKTHRPQAEQLTFWSPFGFMTHSIIKLLDQIVQVALDKVDLLLKQGERSIQDA